MDSRVPMHFWFHRRGGVFNKIAMYFFDMYYLDRDLAPSDLPPRPRRPNPRGPPNPKGRGSRRGMGGLRWAGVANEEVHVKEEVPAPRR